MIASSNLTRLCHASDQIAVGLDKWIACPAAGAIVAGLPGPQWSAASKQNAAERYARISARSAGLGAERMDRRRLTHRDSDRIQRIVIRLRAR
jgi:hypothetical protein